MDYSSVLCSALEGNMRLERSHNLTPESCLGSKIVGFMRSSCSCTTPKYFERMKKKENLAKFGEISGVVRQKWHCLPSFLLLRMFDIIKVQFVHCKIGNEVI